MEFIELLLDFAYFAWFLEVCRLPAIPAFGEARRTKGGPACVDEKIWLSADSKITSSARSALATRPNGGREPRQIQPGMHWGMQKCAKSTKYSMDFNKFNEFQYISINLLEFMEIY